MGRWDVDRLLAEIPVRVLDEWETYFNLEHFGSRAVYHAAAMVASTIANVYREKGKAAARVSDFMPKLPKLAPEPQTWRDQLRIVEALNVSFGGRDLRDKRDA